MSAINLPVILIIVLLLSAAVLAIILAARRSRARGTGDPVIRVTMVIAIVWAAFATIGAVMNAIAILDPGSGTSITMPVRQFWPELPEGLEIEGMTATFSGGFTQLTGIAMGLSLGTRLCWAISVALWWLIPGVIAALIALACHELRAGRAFAPAVAKMAMVTAVVVAAGGFAAQVLGDIGGSMAAAEVLRWSSAVWPGGTASTDFDAFWPEPDVQIQLPFWPLAAGLGFAALAAILRYGSKLQRDQEGLV